MLSKLIEEWSESITVLIASAPDTKYNQCTYTSTSVSGVLTYNEMVKPPNVSDSMLTGTNSGDLKRCKGYFYSTNGTITINSTINGYLVFAKQALKNKQQVIEFYVYELV